MIPFQISWYVGGGSARRGGRGTSARQAFARPRGPPTIIPAPRNLTPAAVYNVLRQTASNMRLRNLGGNLGPQVVAQAAEATDGFITIPASAS